VALKLTDRFAAQPRVRRALQQRARHPGTAYAPGNREAVRCRGHRDGPIVPGTGICRGRADHGLLRR
jgi:hypothetical protein